MDELAKLRQQVDETDSEILSLLAQRFRLTEKIRQTKSETGVPLLDKDRWAEIESRISQLAQAKSLNQQGIIAIYQAIHDYVLKYIHNNNNHNNHNNHEDN